MIVVLKALYLPFKFSSASSYILLNSMHFLFAVKRDRERQILDLLLGPRTEVAFSIKYST